MYQKALRTLKFQMHELLLKKAFKAISEQYQTSTLEDNSKETISNCIKLLLRSKKMYEARSQIVRLLKLIMRREQVKEKMESLKTSEEALSTYEELT